MSDHHRDRSTRSRPLLAVGAALLALSLGAQGCVVYDRSSDVQLHWSFAGFDCYEAEVELVQVILDASDGGTYADSGVVDCRDGSVEFRDIDRGWYRVIARGFPRGGGRATWALDSDLKVHGGFNEFTLDMVPSGSR